MKDKIFLEFSKDKDDGHLHFIGEGSEMKIAVKADSLLKKTPLYDRYGNEIDDFDTNAVDYYYDEGVKDHFCDAMLYASMSFTRQATILKRQVCNGLIKGY